MPEPLIVTIGDHAPVRHETSWVAPNAALIGWIELGPKVSVWYGAVLRAEAELLQIGEGSNIQDNVAVHVDPGFPIRIGANVTVGHNAVIHGCTIEDDCLIGMGAVVMNGAQIGSGSLVAAGAVVPQGAVIPPRSMVAGVPGKVRRELSDDEVGANRFNAEAYRYLLDVHRGATS